MSVQILIGDCRDVLKTLPDESVHCVVTSPPYWGLRDYGNGVAGIGLEHTIDEHMAALAKVFHEARRVLRADGTLWVNYGDAYAGHNLPGWRAGNEAKNGGASNKNGVGYVDGLKPKDLIGLPWRLAFALQAAGWYLRQDIIWHKPNPMPESITDRCTKAHEYLFLLSKSARYYFDQEAILEECSPNTHARLAQDLEAQIGSERAHAGGKTNGNMKAVARRGGGNRSHKFTEAYDGGADEHRTKAGLAAFADKQRKIAEAGSGVKNNDSFVDACSLSVTKRNKRSVWTVGSEPFSQAHFATFPPTLIEPCILAGCPKGGTVLDPFGGAGTTALVADRHGRNSILIELNPEYAAMAKRRIEGDAGMFAQVEAIA
ncbi:MAG TPA: site-specific DNA-methyltransferase [Micropepsaceae bacterium]|nr:site-specific DNA-methyltransferase [Micropepsaceae bacterium]